MAHHPDDADLAGLLVDPAAHLDSTDPTLRRIAVAACATLLDDSGIRGRIEAILGSDSEACVRAEAAETLAAGGPEAINVLIAATEDPDERVVEAATTALGEIGAVEAVPWLEQAARGHADRLVREAAVAALGAIHDPGSLKTILEVLRTGPPQVRRRAAVALAAFDDAAIEPALLAAARDRNPVVRDVASMLVNPPR